MVTLKEVAAACGVSAATVSNILNGKDKSSEETRRRVLAVVEEKGYRPDYIAQGLRRQKTKMIALIAEDIAQFTSPPIIEGIMEYCEEKGYRVTVHNLRLYARWADTWYNRDDARKSVMEPVFHDILSARADGTIYVAGHAREIRCFDDNFPIPAVMSYALSGSDKVPSVLIDDEKSAFEMVDYLLEMGHRRIGFIGGRADNYHTQYRLRGYQQALFQKNIPFDPDLAYYGDWTRASGKKGARELIDKGITAVFSATDQMAGGVYDCMEERGLIVGKDISVAGFDNQEIAEYFRPGLTTTALPLKDIGKEAARLLIAQLEPGEEEIGTEPIKIPCTMVRRKSVTPLAE